MRFISLQMQNDESTYCWEITGRTYLFTVSSEVCFWCLFVLMVMADFRTACVAEMCGLRTRSTSWIRGLTADGFFRGRCGRGLTRITSHSFSAPRWILWASLMKLVLRGAFRGGQCLLTVAYNCLDTDTRTPTCRAMQGAGVNGMGMVIRCSHSQPVPGSCSASCHAPAAERESLERVIFFVWHLKGDCVPALAYTCGRYKLIKL